MSLLHELYGKDAHKMFDFQPKAKPQGQPISLSPEPASLYRAVLALLQSPHSVRIEEGSDRLAYSAVHLTYQIAELQVEGVSAGLLECHEFGPDSVPWYSLTDAGEQWMRGDPVGLVQAEQCKQQSDSLWAAVFVATAFVSSETPLEPTDAEVDAALAFTKRMRDVWGRCGT